MYYPKKQTACKPTHHLVLHNICLNKSIGFDGSPARSTDCVALSLQVFGVFWATCQRVSMKHMAAPCSASTRRNGNMPQRLFQCLAVAIRPLCIEELAEIFAVRFDKAMTPTSNPDWRPVDANEAVLSACSSLISVVDVAGSQIVQFSHFSVKEFLTSERLAKSETPLSCYHILPEPAHTILAHASLSVLLQLDDKIDRNAIRRFPLALYAAQYWIDHARFRHVSSQARDMMHD